MSEEFLLTSEIMANGRFLSVSLLARYLYIAMILLADQEGRASADARTWKAQASLWGVAEVSVEEIAQAIQELNAVGLLALYDEGRRFFLPGRFEHNHGREFWRTSKHPLPPVGLLKRFPEYLQGLRCLTTKGRLYKTTSDSRRYPELWHEDATADEHASGTGELEGTRGESTNSLRELADSSREALTRVDVDEDKMSTSRTLSSDARDDEPPYAEIVAYLNEKTGKHFRPTTSHTRKLIDARWHESYRLDDFCTVIANMAAQRANDPKLRIYLRPETLFGPKFEGYLNSAPPAPAPAGEAYRPFKEEERDYEKR